MLVSLTHSGQPPVSFTDIFQRDRDWPYIPGLVSKPYPSQSLCEEAKSVLEKTCAVFETKVLSSNIMQVSDISSFRISVEFTYFLLALEIDKKDEDLKQLIGPDIEWYNTETEQKKVYYFWSSPIYVDRHKPGKFPSKASNAVIIDHVFTFLVNKESSCRVHGIGLQRLLDRKGSSLSIRIATAQELTNVAQLALSDKISLMESEKAAFIFHLANIMDQIQNLFIMNNVDGIRVNIE